MAKGNNQKLKLLYLESVLREQTDEEHGLSTAELIAELARFGISADRKTLYADLEELRKYGLDITNGKEGRSYLYRLSSREFELPELKLLVDSVQAAKFITEKKSRDLIKKLEALVSIYEAKQLQRQVLISGRVKTMNESIYYNVDKLHSAINENVQIRFQYFQWNVRKEAELRHGGAYYTVSPWQLIWDDEYYYLVAYEEESGILKHFRVDKMKQLTCLETPRTGREFLSGLDSAEYSKRLFGMFGGNSFSVVLELDAAHADKMAAILIDRFGTDIPIIRTSSGTYRATVEVVPSDSFIGWIFSLGDGIRIISPNPAVEKARAMAAKQYSLYQAKDKETKTSRV